MALKLLTISHLIKLMIRVFLNIDKIYPNQIIYLDNNIFLYLKNVMRIKISNSINIFNGKDGDFIAQITEINKKNIKILVKTQNKQQYFPPKISLAFSIVKNNTMESIAKRGVEMGVVKFFPIVTERSFINKFNDKKFLANIIEGSEQSERNDIARIEKLQNLSDLLDNLNEKQILILCDESGQSKKASHIFEGIKLTDKEIIIMVGPEGGFSNEEFNLIKEKKIYSISLGPRILRVDTAIIAALSLVQENSGDWN
tara:strand:- start:202 stop:969 length:768 start_codon:yes stop_codon:yes gene_type:complete